MRTKIVVGNWKMNATADEADRLTRAIVGELTRTRYAARVALCPPFVYLHRVRELIGAAALCVGAQDCSAHRFGAYTGEISALMLSSLGVSYAIVGHSERRQYFAEDNALLARKVDATLAAGLAPIYCCGEPLQARQDGGEVSFVRAQIAEGLFHLPAEAMRRVVIAYEPVWAIGSGNPATPDQAQAMHGAIRSCVAEVFGAPLAHDISMLYGGSVNAANATQLFSCPDIDGGLIGGASLQPEVFLSIVQAAG